jgi:hypothetical protein
MAMGVKHYFKDGKEHKGSLHKMAGGVLHSGKTHTKSSKPLFHYGDLTQKAKRKAREGWK